MFFLRDLSCLAWLLTTSGCHGKLFDVSNLQNLSYLNTLSQYKDNSFLVPSAAATPTADPAAPTADSFLPSNEINQLTTEMRMEFEYATQLLQHKENLMKGSKSLTIPDALPINLLSDQMSYQAIYQDYILNKKAFKGKMKSAEASSGGGAISISLTDCAQAKDMERNAVTNDYSLKNCYGSEMNKVIPVPNIAYNSYSIRFTTTAEDVPHDDLILNLTDHWPTILPLDDNELRPLETCPLDMHMVLWGVTDDLIARVFKADVSSSHFSPQYGDPVAHYFQYAQNGFTPASLPPFAETVIQSGEYLFVPNNHVVSLKPKTSKGSEGSKEKSVLKLCYFDASNVNDVRHALKMESFVSKASAHFLKQLNSPSSFDFAMVREPPAEVKVDQFLIFPKPTDESTKRVEGQDSGSNRRNRGKGDYKDWQETTKWNFLISSLTIPQPPTPSLSSIGRNNVTLEWLTPYLPSTQDQTKFGVNITICLASALTAAADQVSSTSSQNDESINGCVVHSLDQKLLRRKIDLAASAISDSPVVFLQADLLNLLPQTSYQVRLSILYGEVGSSPSPWTSVFVTRPLASPSPPVGPLVAVASEEYPTHAFISFSKPVDDGGLPILGYHVFTRSTDEHHYTEWHWNGIYHNDSRSSAELTLEVTSLFPDTRYEFQVSCFNNLGNSSSSIFSNEIQTSSTGAPTVLVGLNHEDRIQSLPYRKEMLKCEQDPEKCLKNQPAPMSHKSSAGYSLATINDIAQIITLYDRQTNKDVIFEVWDCHWSPRLFQVKGQLAWTIPPLATDSSLFALTSKVDPAADLEYTSLHGKIALVRRGEIPLVYKILNLQRNGAIACLVLDPENCEKFDQTCVPGSQKVNEDRFASADIPSAWENVKIPVLLLKSGDIPAFLELSGLNSYEQLLEIIALEKQKASENKEL